jgi:hypothetical protein
VKNVSNWVLGFAAAVMGIAALFVARGGEGLGYYGGILFFLFCMAFIMRLIKTSYERH